MIIISDHDDIKCHYNFIIDKESISIFKRIVIVDENRLISIWTKTKYDHLPSQLDFHLKLLSTFASVIFINSIKNIIFVE